MGKDAHGVVSCQCVAETGISESRMNKDVWSVAQGRTVGRGGPSWGREVLMGRGFGGMTGDLYCIEYNGGNVESHSTSCVNCF